MQKYQILTNINVFLNPNLLLKPLKSYLHLFPSAGEITSNQDLDYETLRSLGLLTTTVEIRAFDGREYSEPRLLNIEVTNDNEKPEFQQDFYAIETTEGTVWRSNFNLLSKCIIFILKYKIRYV